MEFLKPYKVTRQRNESHEDMKELVAFMSSMSQEEDTVVLSNKIDNPGDFINDPEAISNQFLVSQAFIDETIRGKRIYALTYIFPKDVIEIEDGINMTQQLLDYYESYQSVAAVYEKNHIIQATIIFNNYSIEGEKMTQQFKPTKMSNIYNHYDIKQ